MSAARVAAPVSFVNADLGGSARVCACTAGASRICTRRPCAAIVVLDLGGDRLLPGLINAHDHLQLNHFPRSSIRRSTATSRSGLRISTRACATTRRCGRAPPCRARSACFGGGLKNLLSGVTTVAHHDPLDALLQQEELPDARGARVRLVALAAHGRRGARARRLRWARRPGSRGSSTRPREWTSRRTRSSSGSTRSAACVRNTLLVHALALDASQRAATGGRRWRGHLVPDLEPAAVRSHRERSGDLIAAGRVALGSDSRLTGAGDLLQELRAARQALSLDEATLEWLVTRDSARLLRLPDSGALSAGALADLIVLPAAMPLSQARRADLRLVMLGGAVRYGDPDYVRALAAAADFAAVEVDGAPQAVATATGDATARGSRERAGSEAAGCAREGRMRLKIVLYNPRAVFFTMPLALLAIGSELDPEKYEVVIIDGRLEADAETAVLAQLEGALCLGVTVLTGAPISDAMQISRAASGAPGSAGRLGRLAPLDVRARMPGGALRRRHRAGAGRGDLRRDRATPERGASRSKAARAAPCGSRTARCCENPPRPLLPVEMFRAHDYGLIPVERYFDLKGKRQLDFISSQGCNFRCAFCSDPFVYGRKWVGLDPARMALRLRELWERYRFDDVNFQDETFFTRAQPRPGDRRPASIDSSMKITWAGTMRADQGVRLPDEVWARCKQSGLRRLLVGVESGSDEMLKRIRKDITHRAGVPDGGQDAPSTASPGTFRSSSAFPTRATTSIRATLDCAKRLRAHEPDFQTPIFYFKPYPGSEIVIEAVARGFRLPASARGVVASSTTSTGCPGPWVSREKFELIERFKFFQRTGLEARSASKAPAAAHCRAIAAAATSTAGRSRCCSRAGSCPSRGCHERSAARPADQSDDHVGAQRALPAGGAEPRRSRSRAATRTALLDGNVDRDFVATRGARVSARGRWTPWASRVMGGPQLPPAIAVSKAIRAAAPRCRSSGAATFRPSVRTPRSTPPTSTTRCAARARRRSRELLEALERRRQREPRRHRGSDLARQTARCVHNKERAFSGRQPGAARCPTSASATRSST